MDGRKMPTFDDLTDEQKTKCYLLGVTLVYIPFMNLWVVKRVPPDDRILRTERASNYLRVTPGKQVFDKVNDAITAAAEWMDKDDYWF